MDFASVPRSEKRTGAYQVAAALLAQLHCAGKAVRHERTTSLARLAAFAKKRYLELSGARDFGICRRFS